MPPPLGLPSRASRRSRWRPQNFPAERAGPGGPEGPKPNPGTPRCPSAHPRLGPGRVLPRLPVRGAADRSRSQRRGRARARAPRHAGRAGATGVEDSRGPKLAKTRSAQGTGLRPRRQVTRGRERVMELSTSTKICCPPYHHAASRQREDKSPEGSGIHKSTGQRKGSAYSWVKWLKKQAYTGYRST